MVKSLERAIDLLEIIYLNGGKLTLAEITTLSDMNKTTVYRTLSTFVRKQVLTKDPVTSEYSLQNKTFQLNLVSSNNLSLINLGKDSMKLLSVQFEEPVNLSVLDVQENPLESSMYGGKFIRTVELNNDHMTTDTLLTLDKCQESKIFQPAVYLCFMAFGDVVEGSDDYLENYFKLNNRRLKPKQTYDQFQNEIMTIKERKI